MLNIWQTYFLFSLRHIFEEKEIKRGSVHLNLSKTNKQRNDKRGDHDQVILGTDLHRKKNGAGQGGRWEEGGGAQSQSSEMQIQKC